MRRDCDSNPAYGISSSAPTLSASLIDTSTLKKCCCARLKACNNVVKPRARCVRRRRIIPYPFESTHIRFRRCRAAGSLANRIHHGVPAYPGNSTSCAHGIAPQFIKEDRLNLRFRLAMYFSYDTLPNQGRAGRVWLQIRAIHILLQARRTRNQPFITSAAGGPLFETASAFSMLPQAVNLLLRAGMAGVGVYAALQWTSLRSLRKEVCVRSVCRATLAARLHSSW